MKGLVLFSIFITSCIAFIPFSIGVIIYLLSVSIISHCTKFMFAAGRKFNAASPQTSKEILQ
jgi:hypothetical protein